MKTVLPLVRRLTTASRRCNDAAPWALSHYSDLTLSQEFQPTAAQLSMKAALPLAKLLATASDRCSKTGPWFEAWWSGIKFSPYHSLDRFLHEVLVSPASPWYIVAAVMLPRHKSLCKQCWLDAKGSHGLGASRLRFSHLRIFFCR